MVTLCALVATSAFLVLAGSAWVARAVTALQASWHDVREVASNGGSYLQRVKASAEPLPENQESALSVWVFDQARPDEALREVELAADAGMPEHGHGMNRVPEVARRDHGARADARRAGVRRFAFAPWWRWR